MTRIGMGVASVTTEQMRELDRIAIERAGFTLLQMMENAGRNLASLLRRLIPISTNDIILVLAGTGGNGGGAICAARHLANHGYAVALAVSAYDTLSPAAQKQLRVYRHTNGSEVGIETLSAIRPHVIIDGLLGYGSHGAPAGTIRTMIEYSNAAQAPILSLDVPSGIDATTGAVSGIAIRPTWTMTLALPKTGLREDNSGEVYLADIGIPCAAFALAGIEYVNPFGDDYFVFIERAEE